MRAWKCEWLPIRWPASATRHAVSGWASTQRPWRKYVARTSRRASVSSFRSMPPALAGRSACSASKVRATSNGAAAKLLLDARDDDAADEQALEHEEQDHRDDQGHDVPGLDEGRVREVDAVEVRQGDLERLHVLVAGEVDERSEVVVPGVHEGEDRDRHDHRPGLRQDH